MNSKSWSDQETKGKKPQVKMRSFTMKEERLKS